MPDIPCPNCHHPVSILTTAQVADRLGLLPVTIAEKARDRGIGLRMDARTRVYTEDDVAALAVDYRQNR